MILADKIIEERKRNGWSQEELAEQLGVSRQAVSKWESAGSVPDLQKVIQLAELFGVSTDYLLKDELLPSAEALPLHAASQQSSPIRVVDLEEANDFLNMKKETAPAIANGTALCILSPIVVIILGALSKESRFHITEGLAVGIGCTVLLAMIAAAVFLFITCGIRESRSEHLEKESFETAYGVTGMVTQKRRAFENIFARGIAVGAVLCILASVPVIIAGSLDAPDYITALCVGVLLALVAIGVNIIVRVSIVKSSFDTLLQEGEFTGYEKQVKRKLDALSGAYWCTTTAIYLGWSFWSMRWDFTWIVWPIAGVLFAAVSAFAKLFIKAEE